MANKVDIFGLPLEENANLLASQDLYASPKYRGLSPYQDIVRDEAVAQAMESKLQNDVSMNELMDMSKLPYPSSQGQSEEMIDEDKSNELQNMEFINRFMPKIAQQSQVEQQPSSNEAMLNNNPSQIQESPAITPKQSISSGSSNIMDILKNYREQMKDAQKQAGTSTLLAQLNDTFQRFNKEMVGKKYDPAQTEMFMKAAQKPVEDLETLQAGEMKEAQRESQIRALANKMRLDQISQDPNSPLSKLVQDAAKHLNLNISDYQSLSDAGLTLKDLLTMKQSEMEFDKQLESKKLDADEKTNETKKKFTRDLRKEITSGVHGKQYANFLQAQRMRNAFKEFQKNPSGYTDFGTLMGGLKVLQGDDSVVRGAEMTEGKKATSMINSAMNALDSAINGKTLQPVQRKDIENAVRILGKASKDAYMMSIQPIVEQAQTENIDLKMLLPNGLSEKDIIQQRESTPNTIERKTKDGKIAIFNADTKKFIKYKD